MRRKSFNEVSSREGKNPDVWKVKNQLPTEDLEGRQGKTKPKDSYEQGSLNMKRKQKTPQNVFKTG